jgi:hypothetical protein
MTKISAGTDANKISTTARDGTEHGAAAGFAGIGTAGDSDQDARSPNTRNAKGYPTGTTSFAGGDNS